VVKDHRRPLRSALRTIAIVALVAIVVPSAASSDIGIVKPTPAEPSREA